MRTVSDEEGNRYVLLKESEDSSLVRDPETGEHRHIDTGSLSTVEGASPLATTARAVPDVVRTLLTAVPDERALGLLVYLDAEGPTGVRSLLDSTDLCESDLHGLLVEFQAAGLIEEATVSGERGYAATDTAERALSELLE